MNTHHIVRYILAFLLGEDSATSVWKTEIDRHGSMSFRHQRSKQYAINQIGYTQDPEEMKHYPVVIIPSGFFDEEIYGTPDSIPSLPLSTWRSTPLLFGSAQEEIRQEGDEKQIIIHADIIASTFFMISRYEEMIQRNERDELGRFSGQKSLAYRAEFLLRPIVDEYARHLRDILSEYPIETKPFVGGFSQVNLTHDIDQPYAYSGWRSVARAIWKEKRPWLEALSLSMGNVLADRYYSFPRFLEWNREVKRTIGAPSDTIFFLKTPGKHPLDRPNYTVKKRPIRHLLRLARKYKVRLGLHVNLTASQNPQLIEHEKHRLEKMLRQPITFSRHHFLAVRQPEDLIDLYASGIRDDYSMGYADMVGFRLGTSRPVRFINPSTGVVTKLVLHPLPFMDYTLHSERYMHLGYEQALAITTRCLDETFAYGGEVNLLFHNENLSIDGHPYHVRLYRDLLRHIIRRDTESQRNRSSESVLRTNR